MLGCQALLYRPTRTRTVGVQGRCSGVGRKGDLFYIMSKYPGFICSEPQMFLNMNNIKDRKCFFPIWNANYTQLIPKLNTEYNFRGHARISIGTCDCSSGKYKLDSIPYTLQLNIFQRAQNCKPPHQKHRERKSKTTKILYGN